MEFDTTMDLDTRIDLLLTKLKLDSLVPNSNKISKLCKDNDIIDYDIVDTKEETTEEQAEEESIEEAEESTEEAEESTDEAEETDTEESTEDKLENTYLFYNEKNEVQKEIDDFNYHLLKNSGDWLIAKNIVSSSKENTEFFWDYLDLLFKKKYTSDKSDSFDNIIKVIYSSNESVFEFDTVISKYIVDNLKLSKYKPNGYIFNNNDNNNNIWSFTIIVITNKNIYSANRYIDETTIGCFY